MSDEWSVAPLDAGHERAGFDCGDPELDCFLELYARQNEKRGLSRTYVAVRSGDPRVYGYATLRSGAVAAKDLPERERRRLPRYPVPVVHLARLAVDRRVQGEGVGELLLATVFAKALKAAETLGVYAIEVIAKNERGRGFYARYGFRRLRDDELHMYIAMTVRRASSGQR